MTQAPRAGGSTLRVDMKPTVHSLSSGKVEMFLWAAFHAFTPHLNAWKH